MSDQPKKNANLKVRPDDRRGNPGVKGVIGNPKFVPTDEQREKVRALAKTMKGETQLAQTWIAQQLGISRSTLDRHFREELAQGRGELIAALGAKMVGVAMGTVKDVSREQLDAMKYTLARLGGWTNRIEVTGADGNPIETRSFDLSHMEEESKRQLLAQLDTLLGDRANDNDIAA